MKIFVTGGTGMLGKGLVPQLVAAGHTVRILTRSDRANTPQVEYVKGSLESGKGLAEAIGDSEVVIHAATDFQNLQGVDIDGTKNLLNVAQNIQHFIYVSIVGVDQIPFAYYKIKVQVENLVQDSGIPFSNIRITQFHNFLDMLFHASDKFPVVLFPTGFKTQVIDIRDAAQALVESVKKGPINSIVNIGGPKVYTTRELMRSWKQARGVSRPIVNMPTFGKFGAGFRAGLNTCPDQVYGKITWEEWLAETYGQSVSAVPQTV